MTVVEYRIHPSVGIARMGNSTDTYFVGPETLTAAFSPHLRAIPGTAGSVPATAGTFRDSRNRIAKQAARFRIFAYEYQDYVFWRDKYPTAVWEVTEAEYDIVWTVEVANLKTVETGGTKKPNRPNAVSRSTATAGDHTTLAPMRVAPRVQLGAAVLDDGSVTASDRGTLLVLGSDGMSRHIPTGSSTSNFGSGLHWDDWEDDAADGIVRATVTPKSSSTRPDAADGTSDARSAWVVINMPAYAVDVNEPVGLYDLVMNLAIVNANSGRLCNKDYVRKAPTVAKDLTYLLDSYEQLKWVSPEARNHGRPLSAITKPDFFERLRPPLKDKYTPENFDVSQPQADYGSFPQNMPELVLLSIPGLLYDRMRAWSKDKVTAGTAYPPAVPTDLDRPELMDRAAMGSMCGGSFWPGIEVGRDAGYWQHWTADFGAQPGHVDLRCTLSNPGQLTSRLAIPWQADYAACIGIYWPAGRPADTKPQGAAAFRDWMSDDSAVEIDGNKLVMLWSSLGFVRKISAEYLETERLPIT